MKELQKWPGKVVWIQKKIKVHENSDGSWDVKIKGEDGEKIKTTITRDDLQRAQSETVLGTIESDESSDIDEAADGDIPEGEIAPENVEVNSDFLLADNPSLANDPAEDVLNTSFNDDPIGGQNSDTDKI